MIQPAAGVCTPSIWTSTPWMHLEKGHIGVAGREYIRHGSHNRGSERSRGKNRALHKAGQETTVGKGGR